MIDGSNDAPESAVQKVARLRDGEAYAQARFLPAAFATPDAIRDAKRKVSQSLSPVVARARQLSFADYTTHTIHAHTKNYDVIVTGIVVREPDADSVGDISKTPSKTSCADVDPL